MSSIPKKINEKFWIVLVVIAPLLSTVISNTNLDKDVQLWVGIIMSVGLIILCTILVLDEFFQTKWVNENKLELEKLRIQSGTSMSSTKMQSNSTIVNTILPLLLQNPDALENLMDFAKKAKDFQK
jgi:hypothetical protein